MTENRMELLKSCGLNGISLKPLGLNEIAWKYEDILQLIDMIRAQNVPILGGDVYKMENGVIVPTYDSWYVNGSQDTISNSWDRAEDYIRNYERSRPSNTLYVILYVLVL